MQEVAPEVRELYLKLPYNAYAMAFVAIALAQGQINIMNSAVKWAVGLASLGVAVYVVGRAWRASQNRQANEEANFVNSTGDGGDWRYEDSPWSASLNAAGAAGGPKCRCNGTIMPCKFCGHGVGRPIGK